MSIPRLLLFLLICIFMRVAGQSAKPGLDGMAPSRWTTLRFTKSGGMVINAASQKMEASFEDIYFKTWIPIVNRKSLMILAGPHYRSEQMEFEDVEVNEDHVKRMCGWNLRQWGLDMRTIVRMGDDRWFTANVNLNQSGSLHDMPLRATPMGFTSTGALIRRISKNKEIGYGGMVNWSLQRLTLLPVFIYNQNFSSRSGIEIGLPYRAAWRYNFSASDRFYVKAEAGSRSYFVTGENVTSYNFRRTDIAMGLSYHRLLTRWIGVDVFAGYKTIIGLQLPPGVSIQKPSGYTFALEIFLLPPSKK